jgi:predicted phage terminase large subunit-like protein
MQLDPNASELSILKHKLNVIDAELSLYCFFKQAWHVLEGGTEFVHEWYLEEIANSLQDCLKGKIKNLLINLPPRKGKTNLISIAFPAWVWIKYPEKKFICASYSNSLALKIADKSRLLIESNWYQERWGNRFKLRKDQNSKSYFANDKTGYRISTSAGSFITGSGGDIQITDDPNDPSGESEARLEAVNTWWSQKWFNRVNDARTAVRIAVQQRSQSENDISGNIIKNDVDNEWVKYILPMEYESSVKSNFKDQRTEEGQLLSSRDTPEVIKQIKREMGSYGYAAQYQQRPAPLEGGIIKKHWFRLYPYTELPILEYIVQSWDTALTSNDDSSYSACTTWGIFKDNYDNENVILLSSWRDRLEYPDLRERMKRLANDYRDTGITPMSFNARYNPDLIVVEAKASGDPLMSELKRAGIYARPFIPNKYGDKLQRVRLISSLIESGIVWMPPSKHNPSKLADFADEFVTSVSYFPNVGSRDFVDTMTQALITLRDGNHISHPKDYYEPEEYQETIRVY